MERLNRYTLGYSLKNIPTLPKNEYLKMLIEKTNSFIQRMRWKAHYYLKRCKETDQPEGDNYGFRSRSSAPHVEELERFEEDLVKMTENIEFQKTRNTLQDELQRDIECVSRSS